MRKDITGKSMTKRVSEKEGTQSASSGLARPRGAKGGQASSPKVTIGLDLGDRESHYCILDSEGTVIEEGRLSTTQNGFRRRFAPLEWAVIAMEVGTHSPWVSRLLTDLGHEVLVANARKLRMIYGNRRKQDKVDARMLARVARMDPALLASIQHRPLPMAQDLAVVRSRDVLVRARTQLVNHIRGAVKSNGSRVTRCTTKTFPKVAGTQLPEAMREALSPVLDVITQLTAKIAEFDDHIKKLAHEKYPETRLVSQIPSIAALTSLTFVLTLECPERFPKSRAVGPYLGLVPARSQSGASDPQLRITKEGDSYLRQLLVQAAQRLLRKQGPDCDLRHFGLRIAERGGKNAKKRAVVAVARKLAVLMHKLWATGEVFEPLRQQEAALMPPPPFCGAAA
ncbi:MAG TPA: IS110 family transposase [Acidobacteriota bacterium]|nr:IS110 family transposase [Acidobacteriota bacterium]